MGEMQGLTMFFNIKNDNPGKIVISIIDNREESNTIELSNKNPADFNKDFAY